jgi:hypothetical protein
MPRRRGQPIIGVAIYFGAYEYEAALGVVLNDVSYDSSLGKFFVESFDALGDGDVILYGVPPCLTLLRHYAPP